MILCLEVFQGICKASGYMEFDWQQKNSIIAFPFYLVEYLTIRNHLEDWLGWSRCAHVFS